MRLLFYTRIFRLAGTGAEDYAVKLCKGLADRGHEVHVIADHIDAVEGLHTYADTSAITQIREQVNPDMTVDWQFVHRADVHRMGSGVHASFIRYSLDAYSGASRFYKQLRYQGRKHRDIIARQQQLLADPDALFLPNSQFCAGQALENGARQEHVVTLHNGVDTNHYQPTQDDASRQTLRHAWRVQNDDVVFLFVAHNLRLKNYTLLARIFARLLNSPQFKLVVIGKHRPLRLPGNCRYTGKADDMAAVYRAADVFLHPTYYDSCANVVLEAMSSGLPVVASDRCGANEMITDGESGFELPVVGKHAVTRDAWMKRIIMLGNDAAVRQRIGQHARRAMLDNDFQLYVTKFEAVLEKALRARQANA